MIAQELVKRGAAFIGADGEVRHVIIVHKPGSGYSVTWDSVPLSDPDYYRDLFDKRNTRPHGYMPMRKFQKWAVAAAPTPKNSGKEEANGNGN
jgi:hypothetical protein